MQNFIRNLEGMQSPQQNQFSYKSSFIEFQRLLFQVQIEKKETLLTVTKLNSVGTGVLSF